MMTITPRVKTFGIFCFALVGGLFFLTAIGPKTERERLLPLAEGVFTRCAPARYAPACYDEEVPKLMRYISMEDAFKVVQLIQEKDSRYLYCHVVGHKITYQEAKKDPSKWMNIITRCPANVCNNGCLHGAVLERFTNETLTDAQIKELMPSLRTVCEARDGWKPTNLETSMCYHGIGHLFMYTTNADAAKSSLFCKELGTRTDGKNFVQTCTEGVFMQIYQPLEPEDFALVRDLTPQKENVPSFCEPYKTVSDMAWQACRREAWALFRNELGAPQGLVSFCSYAKDYWASTICYSALMNDITVRLIIDTGKDSLDPLEAYCNALPQFPKALCYGGAAMRLMQTDATAYQQKTLSVCMLAEKNGVGDVCYEKMASYGQQVFHAGTKERASYCALLPHKFQARCNGDNSIRPSTTEHNLYCDSLPENMRETCKTEKH